MKTKDKRTEKMKRREQQKPLTTDIYKTGLHWLDSGNRINLFKSAFWTSFYAVVTILIITIATTIKVALKIEIFPLEFVLAALFFLIVLHYSSKEIKFEMKRRQEFEQILKLNEFSKDIRLKR